MLVVIWILDIFFPQIGGSFLQYTRSADDRMSATNDVELCHCFWENGEKPQNRYRKYNFVVFEIDLPIILDID